ncbi:hypothetical protein QYM36_004177 [Artemia franciscana]|uniref:Uncharacterized protein n=1 Tax=Artemia franciscana TaxID=6661 RepID=A0AA88HXX3_ARTSF|nr:hypothetical protein QYM36_004177 [Artemia franciscana]
MLVLKEVRWSGSELDKPDGGYTLAFNGDPIRHLAVVGALMSPSASKAMVIRNPINESITYDVPRHDILCVTGDLNTEVGADRQYYLEAIGTNGIRVINENRVLLVDHVLSNDLIIGFGVNVIGQQLTDLDFADNVVLLDESKQCLPLLVDTIVDKAEKVGLIVNVGKLKSMVISQILSVWL